MGRSLKTDAFNSNRVDMESIPTCLNRFFNRTRAGMGPEKTIRSSYYAWNSPLLVSEDVFEGPIPAPLVLAGSYSGKASSLATGKRGVVRGCLGW